VRWCCGTRESMGEVWQGGKSGAKSMCQMKLGKHQDKIQP
jgi:hypothetical protein